MFRYDEFNSRNDFETEGNVLLSEGRKWVQNWKSENLFYFTNSQTERSQKKDMKIMLQKNDQC